MIGIGITPIFGGKVLTPVEKILKVQPDNIVALWGLTEESGTTAVNSEGTSDRNGTYLTDVSSMGTAEFIHGGTAPDFDGSNDAINIYSASLNSAFDGDNYTVALWLKPDTGSLTDGSTRYGIRLYGGSSNFIRIVNAVNGAITLQDRAGGTDKTLDLAHSSTDWRLFAITKSSSTVKFWRFAPDGSGGQVGTTQTSAGTWAGTLDTSNTVIGSANITPLQTWAGLIGPTIIWSTPLSESELGGIASG